MFKVFFEDLSVGAKREFGRYEVTREEVIEFASKYDPQLFHLDDEAAKQSPFGALCASGWHTASMSMRLLVDDLKATGFASMGSPGIDKLRWRRPVFPGDTLRVRTEILALEDMPKRNNLGLSYSLTEVLNQDDVVVMSHESKAMVLRRTPLTD